MSIISDIYNGVKKEWSVIAGDIEAMFAVVKSALPASAQGDIAAAQQELKQAASLALGAAVAGVVSFEPAFVKGLEASADGALAALTGGLSVPFNPLLNNGIEDVVAKGTAALQAWGLAQKANAVPKVGQPNPGVTIIPE